MGEEIISENQSYNKYALSGKIMLSAIIILFTVILLVVCLHIYTRWYLARYRRQRQQLRNARRRGPQIIFISDLNTATNANALTHGLEPSVLNSLPTFVYSPTTHTQECAVCLSEFEENEKGRLLPKCSHSFHIECIDMWFASHSTCPLCRSPVVGSDTPNQIEVVVDPPNNQIDTHTSATPSSSSRLNLSIEVPRRNESFKSLEDEVQESPLRGFKSPGGRMRSLKRILSRDTRPPTPMSCGSVIDLERGGGGGEPSARPNES